MVKYTVNVIRSTYVDEETMTPAEMELRWQVDAFARDVLSAMRPEELRSARRAIDGALHAWQKAQVGDGQQGSRVRHNENSALHAFSQLSPRRAAARALSPVATYAGIGSTAETFCALVLDQFEPAERAAKAWSLAQCTAILVRREVKQMHPRSLVSVLEILWLHAFEGRQHFKDQVRTVRRRKAQRAIQIRSAQQDSLRVRKDKAEHERETVRRYAEEILRDLPRWEKQEVFAEKIQKRMRDEGEKVVPSVNRIVRRLRGLPPIARSRKSFGAA